MVVAGGKRKKPGLPRKVGRPRLAHAKPHKTLGTGRRGRPRKKGGIIDPLTIATAIQQADQLAKTIKPVKNTRALVQKLAGPARVAAYRKKHPGIVKGLDAVQSLGYGKRRRGRPRKAAIII